MRSDEAALDMRARHERLRLRFLNPHLRLIGQDVQAIDLQMEEKKAALAREQAETKGYARHEFEIERDLRTLDLERRVEKHNNTKALAQTWKQQNNERKELKKQYAAADAAMDAISTRAGGGAASKLGNQLTKDFAVHPGVSSAQVFDGEDQGSDERRAMQAVQVKEWAKQVGDEKRSRKAAEQKEDVDYAGHVRNMVARTDRLEEAETRDRNAQLSAIQAYNNDVGAKRRKQEQADREAQRIAERESHEKATTTLYGDSCEPQIEHRGDDPDRHLKDRFRGLSKSALAAIVEQQRTQVLMKEQRRASDADEERRWAQQQQQVLRASSRVALEERNQQRDQERLYQQHQRQQIEERQEREAREKDERRNAGYEPSFFDRFGKSHR